MKQLMSKSQNIILGTLLTSALLGSSLSVMADDKGATKAKTSGQILTERGVETNFPGWNDPVIGHIAAFSGQALIRQLQMAKVTLKEKKLGEAKGALIAAKDFARGLQKMIPFIVVVDQAKNTKGKIVDSAEHVVIDDMLPVYQTLVQMEVDAPELAKKTHRKLKEAHKHAKLAKKKPATEKLEEVADDITTTTIYMPVVYVSEKVNQALKALNGKKPNAKTAKTAVSAALDSLVAASVNMDETLKNPK